MKDLFVWFWTAMIFSSIAWYAYLLFHVGYQGGRDILRMARALSERADREE
jgi:hypothetical protein